MSLSRWILLFCEWIRYGMALRQLPDLGMSKMDRQRRFLARMLFLFLWIPFCLFFLVLILRPEWFA